MPLDDTVRKGEADACPLEMFLAVHPLEHTEELSGVQHVEPRAVVSHEVDRPVLLEP